MIRARLFIRNGQAEKLVREISLTDRPLVGSEIAGEYKILAISSPVPMGRNLSGGEPEMGIRILVKELRKGVEVC